MKIDLLFCVLLPKVRKAHKERHCIWNNIQNEQREHTKGTYQIYLDADKPQEVSKDNGFENHLLSIKKINN